MSEWQPIETAPKDGTWVRLLTSEGEDVGRFQETRYCMIGPPQGSYGPGFVDQFNGLPMHSEFEPTHWKSLQEAAP